MRKGVWIAALALGVPFAAIGSGGAPAEAQQAGAAIAITKFMYNPDQVSAGVGQPITITNNDGFPHTVTAKDGTFNVEVPEKGTVTLSVPKPGSFAYSCTYHPGQHNPASINAS